MYGGVWLFTNHDFLASDDAARADRRLQAPIGALELHVSYDVNPRLWISADFNYGGRVSVNGERHVLTLQSNSRVGVTASAPVSRRQSLKISYSDGLVVALWRQVQDPVRRLAVLVVRPSVSAFGA
jgi:hypothetical protein